MCDDKSEDPIPTTKYEFLWNDFGFRAREIVVHLCVIGLVSHWPLPWLAMSGNAEMTCWGS
jgi:hypothetical protein